VSIGSEPMLSTFTVGSKREERLSPPKRSHGSLTWRSAHCLSVFRSSAGVRVAASGRYPHPIAKRSYGPIWGSTAGPFSKTMMPLSVCDTARASWLPPPQVALPSPRLHHAKLQTQRDEQCCIQGEANSQPRLPEHG